MMLDADVVAASPASVYRVLKAADVIGRGKVKRSSKGCGFDQPSRPHRHWHVDISYINIAGTFYYLCSVLDGYSRCLLHWEIREAMREVDIRAWNGSRQSQMGNIGLWNFWMVASTWWLSDQE